MFVLGLQSDADVDDDFSFLQPLDLITKDVHQLQRIVREKKDRMNAAAAATGNEKNERREETERESVREMEEERREREREEEEEDREEKLEKDREEEVGKDKEKTTQDKDQNAMEQLETEENGTSGGNLRKFVSCVFID